MCAQEVWGILHVGLDPRTYKPMDPTMDGWTMYGRGGGGGKGDQPPPPLIDNTVVHVVTQVLVCLVSFFCT